MVPYLIIHIFEEFHGSHPVETQIMLYFLDCLSPCFYDTAAAAKSLQPCLTLCNPIDGSPSGSPVPEILQARTLEQVAISFSSAWKWKVKVKSLSRVWLLATPWTAAHQAPPSMAFSRQEYWSGVPLTLGKNKTNKQKTSEKSSPEYNLLELIFFSFCKVLQDVTSFFFFLLIIWDIEKTCKNNTKNFALHKNFLKY